MSAMTMSWCRSVQAVPAAACLVLAACGGGGPPGDDPAGPTLVDPVVETSDAAGAATTRSAPTPTVATMDTLVLSLDGPHVAVVVDEGGQCGDGPCRTVLELLADGRWSLLDQAGQVLADGTYDGPQLAVQAQTASADPGLLTSGPFQGRCPTAGGGRERFYRILDQTAPTVVAIDLSSCTDQLNADAALLVSLDLLLTDAERLATELG